jgi:hypothetical protein
MLTLPAPVCAPALLQQTAYLGLRNLICILTQAVDQQFAATGDYIQTDLGSISSRSILAEHARHTFIAVGRGGGGGAVRTAGGSSEEGEGGGSEGGGQWGGG